MLRFVIAHAGGWDEFLMFAIPVALGVWALRYTEQKARRRAEAQEKAQGEEQVPTSATGDEADEG